MGRRGMVAFALMVASMTVSLWISRGASSREATAKRHLADGILRIVVIGDSVAHGAGDETGRGIEGALDSALNQRGVRFAPAVNAGINGARTPDVLRRLRHAPLIATADAVVVSIGGNDLYGDAMARLRSIVWPELATRRALGGINAVVARIHAINPAARIMLLGLYNPYRQSAMASFLDTQINRWDANLIARFANDPRVTVIRIVDLLRSADRLSSVDHFHPSSLGYSLIAARIAPAL